MQPKLYHLRLSLEQLHHTTDGWVENRKCIDEDSLDLYDSQFADVLDQFQSQGVEILIDLEDQDTHEEEAREASEIMDLLYRDVLKSSMDEMERAIVVERIQKLNTLLFGE
jgi:3-isopropylmalate dehydratase small subunit